MGRRRSILTKKEIEMLNRADPSGRLTCGVLGTITIVIGWFMSQGMEELSYMANLCYILGVLMFVFVIVKSITMSIKEKELQNALLQNDISTIKNLSPIEFEEYVSRMFSLYGYNTELTPRSSDYGIDVILKKGEFKIGVQVKKYSNNVGVKAVQEVIAGMQYYGCDEGWVITSADSFTKQAHNLANVSGIKLIAYNDLALILSKIKKMNEKE